MMQQCCAPDFGVNGGCDNVTMILVAILNHRSLDQWYDWIADRVEQKTGYDTPEEYPDIFSMSEIIKRAPEQRYYRYRLF